MVVTDDIASRFIDTDYNGESFFVRQAYSYIARRAIWETLKRALQGEIDQTVVIALQHDVVVVEDMSPSRRRRHSARLAALLSFWIDWHHDVGSIRVINPPCGSDAFLI